MARKVNPISVRLHLNRSSDSSRFSDYYHGKPMYQDVNPREYFGSIRPPTRKTFGFRLGRCILHHSPKRTFIHLFPPRRPQRLRRRGRSKPGKRWWAMGKAIGRLDRKDSTRSAPSIPHIYRGGWRAPSPSIDRDRDRVLSTPLPLPLPLYISGSGSGSGERETLGLKAYIGAAECQLDIAALGLLGPLLKRKSAERINDPYIDRGSPYIDMGCRLSIYSRAALDPTPQPPMWIDGPPTPNPLYSMERWPPQSPLDIWGGRAPIYIGGRRLDIAAPHRALYIYGGRERGINAPPSLYALTGPYRYIGDRSEVIWRRRSPSSQYFLGGSHKCYLRVSGWLAPYTSTWPMSVSRNSNDFPSRETKCFNFLLPRIHSRQHSRQNMVSGSPTSRRLLQTIPAVRPSSNHLVMQYSLHMENRIWIWGLNHFVAPDSSLDKRIRFPVESLTAKTRSATTYPARSGHPHPHPHPHPLFVRVRDLRHRHRYLDRSLLFPLLGATLLFPRENRTLGVGGGSASSSSGKWGNGFQQIDAREQLLGKLGRVVSNRLGSGLGLVEKSIDLGGLMRRMGMMIGIIPKNRRIPYGYNYYLNEVRKMRSLLSGGTNANTSIGSVKIESVYQSASPIAQDISSQLRDGTRSFRSIFGRIVRDIPLVMPKGVGGIRICCPGRLKGAEIARTECREYGKTSCNAFRHQIDYAYAKVSTRYGILGVKVWIPFP
uniref:Small ribosomal subunit protein uS3m n=1 Tax=Amentotaxus argotaenia TaxID=25625 RepID=D2DX69_AMEAR|nr:ribosomal protein S3 [Amentotaxus argotaenia]